MTLSPSIYTHVRDRLAKLAARQKRARDFALMIEDLAADVREFRRDLFLIRLSLAAKAEQFSRPLIREVV